MKKFEDLTYDDLAQPRYRRARRTANTIMSIMRDFIPQDRDRHRVIGDYLVRLAYESNVEFVNVPPEWDALDKIQIEAAVLKAKMEPIVLNQPMTE